MPFKPNYRLQRADRQRAKEEKLQKKLARRAERDTGDKPGAPDPVGDDGEPGTPQAELPS